MPLFKYTFFGSDGRNSGWSNSLYRQETSNDLSDLGLALSLLAVWAPLLGKGAKFTFARKSDDAVRGDGYLQELGGSQFTGNGNQPIEQAGSCILAEGANTNYTKRKPIFLHGVWDAAIEDSVLKTPTGWTAKVNAWKARLIGDAWGWKTTTGKVQSLVATVTAKPGDKVEIAFVDPIFTGPFDGSHRQIRISGVTSTPKMRNPLVVIPKDANTCTTFRQFANPVAVGAIGYRNTYGLQPIEVVSLVRPTTRKVGRPFRPQAGGRLVRR